MNNYDLLIARLDAFIRKYYANKLLRGSLVMLICILCYMLTVSVGEYFLYMPVWLRVSLVSLFILLGGTALVAWIIIPASKMAKLGKLISHEQAAAIVGTHFPEVADKLLNILQLKRQSESYESRQLIEASINQKAKQISLVPITLAVDLSKNKKLLPYLLPPVLVGVFILVAAPNVFRDASERLLQPTKTFEKPAPFRFVVTNKLRRAVRNADFVLDVKTEGEALPADMAIVMGDERIPMNTIAQNNFRYTFRNVTTPVEFRLYAAGFYSKEYKLSVVQKPVLKALKVHLDYPDYTGRQDEERTSIGDITVPAGTKVSWSFSTEHADEAAIRMGNGAPVQLPRDENRFASQYRFLNDTAYTLILRNKQNAIIDSFSYNVKVIADQYPVIQLQEFRDTVAGKQILLTGTAGDDYGINKLLFHYEVNDAHNKLLVKKAVPLNISRGTLTNFAHYFDMQTLNLQMGQKLTYYVEAWDNDGVYGSKASRSELMSFQMYSPEQLDSAINENAQQINSGLSNSAQHTKQLQSEYKELQSKMLQSDNMDWEQQQSLQEIAKKQMELQSQMEAVKQRFEEQVQQSKQKEYSQDVRDKQEDLKKQMDNLLNKELQEQLKKLQELMQKLNKDQAFQQMKQLEQDNKLFNMDMQRMQELMKKLEMQMRLEDLANKVNALSKKQLDLKDQTDKAKKDNQALGKEQEDLKKELEKNLKEDMKQMQELNDQMKQAQNMQQPQQQGEQAKSEMQKSEEQLGKNENSKSSQSQSKAAQNLQNMAASLRSMAGGMDVQQIELDIRTTRQILTNLIRLSFDEEQLMKKVQNTATSSQSYLENQQEQNRLHANSLMIKDSLFALSKRVSKLSATVNRETSELERNLGVAVDALENRRVGDALTRQQYVMTHTNNLALMLNELLSNLMQMQSQAKNSSAGSCNKPGGMNPKPGAGQQLSDIITKQQQLGNAMQQMQHAQQQRDGKPKEGEGEKDGQQGKPGEKGKPGENGEYGDAEEIARVAQQQAAIRRQLQELNSLLNSKGLGNAKELREIQEKMDKTETDLVNRRLSSELMMRQREILTRLLQAEKSLREQDQDDKRSSNKADEISRPVPPELQKFMKDRASILEQYKTAPPQLKPYYRDMVQRYYRMLGTQ